MIHRCPDCNKKSVEDGYGFFMGGPAGVYYFCHNCPYYLKIPDKDEQPVVRYKKPKLSFWQKLVNLFRD